MLWRCLDCRVTTPGGRVRYMEWEGGDGACPRCSRRWMPDGIGGVQQLVHVHLIVHHADGPIYGPSGRQQVACMPRRDFLAAHAEDTFAATGEPPNVTCPACQSTQVFRDLSKLYPQMEMERMAREALGLNRPGRRR